MPATNDVFTLTAEEEEEACTRALQLSCDAVVPMVLKVAIELGLLSTPLSSEEIAAQLPSEHPESAAACVDRILRLLAANKIVGCIGYSSHSKQSGISIVYILNDDYSEISPTYLSCIIMQMKWILHDWNDGHCAKLLNNCWKALPEKGKVIVIECVLPVVPEAAPRDQYIYQLDICMSTYNIGGKERTEQEFHALAMDAGFSGFKALPMFAGTCIMEFTK
ncbi:unnamed protein product [Musa textilis]